MKTKLFLFFILLGNICFSQENNSKSPAGIWFVKGHDKCDTSWKAKLVLFPKNEDYPPTKFKGYFDWAGSNRTGGREFIIAEFDYEKMRLEIKGDSLQNADPNIKTTIYVAFMDEENKLLKDGEWQSCGVCPGEWEAERSAVQPVYEPKRGPIKKQKAKVRCNDGVCEVEEDEENFSEFQIMK